jgi:circadian clock protein KaiB
MVLMLFVAGRSRRAVEAERAARSILDRYGGPGSRLEVIDVFVAPDQAEAAGILATPTLLRVSPGPTVRVIGELDDVDLLVGLLDLPEPTDREGAS